MEKDLYELECTCVQKAHGLLNDESSSLEVSSEDVRNLMEAAEIAHRLSVAYDRDRAEINERLKDCRRRPPWWLPLCFDVPAILLSLLSMCISAMR